MAKLPQRIIDMHKCLAMELNYYYKVLKSTYKVLVFSILQRKTCAYGTSFKHIS